MSGTCIVVEEGVIQCEHGAPVILKSTVPNHVIGGKKPLFTTDLLEAKVDGCGYNSSNGGQCKIVASITSAITETNNSNAGKNYLLRVDGCKTDNGSSLVLVDPGQTNTVIPVKSGGSAGSITAKELEDARVDTKKNILREKYRIHPLRESNGHYRALRGARDFRLLRNFHQVSSGDYTHDKVVTKTDAYLYVTSNGGKPTEYKVINRGDLFNPIMHKVQFKDTKTNIIRRYIPFYEEKGKLEFVYSNIKLTDAQVGEFPSKELIVEEKKNSCVIHLKVYSKAVKEEIKTFKKKELEAGTVRAESKTRAYVSTLLYLKDPIGEVEDFYNDYEFSYHRYYGMNKAIIDDIKAKNQYPYAVADMLDYIYVNKEEREEYNQQRELLQTKFEQLSNIVITDMADIVKSNMSGNFINSALDYTIAKDYLDEVKFIDSAILQGTSYKNSFTSLYNSFKLHTKDRTYQYATGKLSNPALEIIRLKGKEYKTIKKSAFDVLAMLTFSVCYGEKYKNDVDNHPRLKAASEEFFYLIKNAKSIPHLHDGVLDDIEGELKNQTDLKPIFSGENKLLTEFESLDDILKEIAFDPKAEVAKRNFGNKFGFKDLKVGTKEQKLYYNKNLKTPTIIAEELAKLLASSDLKSTIGFYKDTLGSVANENEHDYYHYLLNLSYMLIAPRASVDAETRVLSLFNDKHTGIQELINFLTKQLNLIGEEKAKKLHSEEIKEYYLKGLYSLIAHAKVEKPNHGFKESSSNIMNSFIRGINPDNKGRDNNATALLEEFKSPPTDKDIKTKKILDQNFAEDMQLKSESEKLYATLQNLNGVSSYLNKLDGTADDMGSREDEIKPEKSFRNSKSYKKLLASTQVFSFFMTAGNIVAYTQGKEKLKINNLIGLTDDILALSNDVYKFLPEPIKGTKLYKAKKLTESLEHLVGVDKITKVVSASNMKVIARFGLIGVMANAANEMSEIDPKENASFLISVGAKNAIYMALLFSPGWIALGSMALLELVWFFTKDTLENSKIELYLYDSLLFNTLDHNRHTFFHVLDIPKGKYYKTPILQDTMRASGKEFTFQGKEADGFIRQEHIRDFIAQTQESSPEVIEAAMISELSYIKSILYGINMERDSSARSIELSAQGIGIRVNSSYNVKLSDGLFDIAQEVYVSYDKQEQDGTYNTVYQELPKNKDYNIVGELVLRSKEFETLTRSVNLSQMSNREKLMWRDSFNQEPLVEMMLKNMSIFIISDKMTIKYDLAYNIVYSNVSKNSDVEITEVKHIPFHSYTEDDKKFIEDNKK